jgi:hypothetical protein
VPVSLARESTLRTCPLMSRSFALGVHLALAVAVLAVAVPAVAVPAVAVPAGAAPAAAAPGGTSARDPAARGLDIFVHAAPRAAAGGRLAVQLRVFGFPRAGAAGRRARRSDLGSAVTGTRASSAPLVVAATADAAGRAHVDVEVPRGKVGATLWLSARWGDHQRTRELTVTRLDARARARSI